MRSFHWIHHSAPDNAGKPLGNSQEPLWNIIRTVLKREGPFKFRMGYISRFSDASNLSEMILLILF